MIRHRFSIASLLLAGVVFLSPLPFGSVGPGFRMALCGAVVLTFLVSCWTGPRVDWSRVRTPALLLFCIATLALLQSVSWPSALAKVTSPAHVEMARKAALADSSGGLTRSAPSPERVTEVADSSPGWVSMSFAPRISRRAAVGWAVAAFALLVGASLRSRREHRLLFGALIAAAVFQAVYGAPHVLGQQDVIWGQAMPPAQGRLRGTFVNPNHAAFFFGMALPIVAAWGLLNARRSRDGDYHRFGVLAVGLPWLVWLILAAALLLTQSRGGALVMVMVFALQLAITLRRNARLAVILSVLLIAGVLLVLLGGSGGAVLERFEEARSAANPAGARSAVYAATLGIWADFPVLGTGLGSFRQAFSALGPAEIRGQWWNAHSDWIEILATGGLAATGLLLAALGLTLRRLWRRLGSRSRERRASAVAVIGVLLAATLHSFIDFGLSMPANAVVLALVVGTGLATRPTSPRSSPGQDPAAE